MSTTLHSQPNTKTLQNWHSSVEMDEMECIYNQTDSQVLILKGKRFIERAVSALRCLEETYLRYFNVEELSKDCFVHR